MIDAIIVLLGQINDVYSKLYDLSEKKKEHIIKNEAQQVGEIIKQEWLLMEQATTLEDKRTALMDSIFQDGQDGGAQPPSIDDLLGRASAEQAVELREMSERLKDTIVKQKKINAENQSLIELHLDYMDYMINTVVKEPEVSNIYGNSGTVEESAIDNRSILDSEA